MNMLESIDFWKFLAGLGIFLFGIYMMEESIKLLAGRAFKKLIRKTTGSRLKGILSGTFSTAVLQSSSAVSLMALAFTGAGLMSLINAIAVMMGAKIGTTMTAWIVAVFGFKFQIEAFALPIIGVGGLGLILLVNWPRYVNISKFLVAFGFLFLGLDYMKGSVEELAASIDLIALTGGGLWIWFLAGMVLTAIIQSSSTTIAIVLTFLFSEVIDFNSAASMVIGANIGTTVTVMLGSIGGVPVKKQAAVSQLILVTTTAIVTFLLLPVLVWLILEAFGFSQNLVLGLALFHTVFNVLGVALFFPWIPRLSMFVKRIIPEQVTELTRFINNTDPEIPEAAMVAVRKEIICQLDLSMTLISRIYETQRSANGRSSDRGIMYVQLERYHAEIFQYYARMLAFELDKEEAGKLERYIRASRSVMNATKNLYELHSQVDRLRSEESDFMHTASERLMERVQNLDALVKAILKEEIPEESKEKLENLYHSVEEDDKLFIHSCAWAISSEEMEEENITHLLMLNRIITQSLRMLVLSMQGLIDEVDSIEQKSLG
ncbi:MAG: Na/Pi symporter [Balneolaceae bacterium]